jgi:hypothetical protein
MVKAMAVNHTHRTHEAEVRAHEAKIAKLKEVLRLEEDDKDSDDYKTAKDNYKAALLSSPPKKRPRTATEPLRIPAPAPAPAPATSSAPAPLIEVESSLTAPSEFMSAPLLAHAPAPAPLTAPVMALTAPTSPGPQKPVILDHLLDNFGSSPTRAVVPKPAGRLSVEDAGAIVKTAVPQYFCARPQRIFHCRRSSGFSRILQLSSTTPSCACRKSLNDKERRPLLSPTSVLVRCAALFVVR